MNISLIPEIAGRSLVDTAEAASRRMFQIENSVIIFIPAQRDVATQHPWSVKKCVMLRCEKINAYRFFRDLDNSFRVV